MLRRYVVLLVIGFGLTFCEDTIFDLAKAGDLKAVKEKIKSEGFDPEATDLDGYTVIHYAAYSASLDMVKYLVNEQKADPNATDNKGRDLLYYATMNNDHAEIMVDYVKKIMVTD